MNQVNLGQEFVKETMMELRDSIEGNPTSRKRAYYQTITSDREVQGRRGKQPRLSSEINMAYLDKQYGKILEVSREKQLRRGIREHFLELDEAAKKWELLNYHLQVICHENPELDSLPALDSEIYLKREEAYLMVSLILKMYKHIGLVQKQHRLQSLSVIPEYHFPRASRKEDISCHGVSLVNPPDVLGFMPVPNP